MDPGSPPISRPENAWASRPLFRQSSKSLAKTCKSGSRKALLHLALESRPIVLSKFPEPAAPRCRLATHPLSDRQLSLKLIEQEDRARRIAEPVVPTTGRFYRASSATAPRLPDADQCRFAGTGQTWDLPVPAQRASAHARFFDHAGLSETLALTRPSMLPSAFATASAPRI